jgi:hypothetical protein
MVNLPEDGPNTAAESESILSGLGAGAGRRPVRGAGKKKSSFKTSAGDFSDDAESQAIRETLAGVDSKAPTGERVAEPAQWKVKVSGGMSTKIEVPGARKRNHFDDFMDLHDDLESAVMALGATTENIPASKSGPGATVAEQRGAYELARSLLANASASMAKAGVAHTAGNYVTGRTSFGKTQPKVDKGIYDIANEVTPKIPGQYVKPTQALTGKEGPQFAADHMKLAAATYGQVGNLLTNLSGAFGQKFKNSYGKSGSSYGDAANEIADDYARKLSRNPEYASTINAGSDKSWQPFSVKPVERTARTLFPASQDHDINAGRTVRAAIDIQSALARLSETGSMKGSVGRGEYVSPTDTQRANEVDAAKAHWLSKNPQPQFFHDQNWTSKEEYDAAYAAHLDVHKAWLDKKYRHETNMSWPGKARAYLTSEGAAIPEAPAAPAAPAAPRTPVEALSARNAAIGTQKVIARKAQDEAFATYAPNIAASEEIDRKNDLEDRKAASEARAAKDAKTRARVDAGAQAIADGHNETFPPMTEMYNGVQKLAIDAMDKGVELHKDVFKHLGNAYKSFGGHSAQVTRVMPYLADVTKHTNRAMDEVTNAARRLQQSGVHHPLLTQIVQDGAAQLAAGKYAGRLRTINDGGFSAKPSINTSAITNLPRQADSAQ